MNDILLKLSKTIDDRMESDPKVSYTAYLLKHEKEKCAEKFGEEAIELIVAAAKLEKTSIVKEAADVVYHLMVLLKQKGIRFEEVLDVLNQRGEISGLDEKASRKTKT